MKEKLIIIVVAIFILFGCAGLEPSKSVCNEARPAQFVGMESHICATAAMAGMVPEDIDGLLLDATAMAFVTDAVKIKDIEVFLNKARKFLKPDQQCAGVSFNAFIDFIDLEAEKAIVLKSVINRRVYAFRSLKTINAFDCWMLEQSMLHQAEQFGLKVM
jgi:hypothetical protein